MKPGAQEQPRNESQREPNPGQHEVVRGEVHGGFLNPVHTHFLPHGEGEVLIEKRATYIDENDGRDLATIGHRKGIGLLKTDH
jgi:hypothetical protein